MGKKRKICASKKINEKIMNNPIYIIIEKSQYNDTFHKKYIKELKQIYEKSKHNKFFESFKKILMKTIMYDVECENANRILLFCAKFLTSFDRENTHILLASTFNWILKTISESSLVRFRLCEFVNKILNALGTEAILEDCICDAILKYMIERLKDISPNVRVQAIFALHRLQIPDSPNDVVIKSYLFHLSNDPSPRVRQAVISSIVRNFHTIPCILERLWDIDEKVRRHTYLQMSSYSVKLYKVKQRLTFLEQGLKENSEITKKVVVKVLLPQWFETYHKSFIAFISALKIDASNTEIERFVNVSKTALSELFKHRISLDTILSELPMVTNTRRQKNNSDSEDDLENDEEIGDENHKIVPLNQLTIEMAIYWSSVIDYIQTEHPDEIDLVLPELTAFCNYIASYCESKKREMDKWEKHVHENILLILVEILSTYDLGDETGRTNLLILLKNLLCHYELEERVIKIIIKLYENLITDMDARFQYLIDIIHDLNMSMNLLNNDRQLIDEIIKNNPDKDMEIIISTLKLKILDLRERESRFVEKKDYVNAQKIAEELITYNEEYSNLLNPLRSDNKDELKTAPPEFCSQNPKKVTNDTTIKCLQIAYFMIVSIKVKSITPNVCTLYKDFIRRNIESVNPIIREWSLKLSTAISMLYELLAKDVFVELNLQFYKSSDTRIWKTTIQCIFEMIDRFGFKFFDIDEKQNKDKKKLRQLFSNTDNGDAEEEKSQFANGTEIMLLMSHVLDTCEELCIIKAVIEGFSRLVLRGHYTSNEIISKLLLKYFNPVTEIEINQILGLLFEGLIMHKKQELLVPSLLPTLYTILEAPNESPLQDIKPQIVLKFVIDSTRPQFCPAGLNIHNTLAITFLNALVENTTNKNLIKLLSKELLKLEISDDPVLRNDLKIILLKFIAAIEDKKSIKDIIHFNDMLDGKISIADTSAIKKNSDSDVDENETSVLEQHLKEASLTIKPENVESKITLQTEDAIIDEKISLDLTNVTVDQSLHDISIDNSLNVSSKSDNGDKNKNAASQESRNGLPLTPAKILDNKSTSTPQRDKLLRTPQRDKISSTPQKDKLSKKSQGDKILNTTQGDKLSSTPLREIILTRSQINRVKANNIKEALPKLKTSLKQKVVTHDNKTNKCKKPMLPYVKLTPISKTLLRKHLYCDSDSELLKTRSATKRHYKENNVITRKRSLEKMLSADRNSIISSLAQSLTQINKNTIISIKLGENNKQNNKIVSRISRAEKIIDDDEIKSPPRSRSKSNTNNIININLRNNKKSTEKILINNNNNNTNKEIKNKIKLRSTNKNSNSNNLQENILIKKTNDKETLSSINNNNKIKNNKLESKASHTVIINTGGRKVNIHNTRSKNNIIKMNKKYK